MRESGRKVIVMQWIVISVLVVGAAVGGYMLVNKVNSLSDSNTMLTGSNDSLHRQVTQLRAQLSATPSPTPDASTPTPSPTGVPTPSPSPTATPKR